MFADGRTGRMSVEPREFDEEESVERAVRPVVPEGVIRGIEDIESGNTAPLDDLKEASKF